MIGVANEGPNNSNLLAGVSTTSPTISSLLQTSFTPTTLNPKSIAPDFSASLPIFFDTLAIALGTGAPIDKTLEFMATLPQNDPAFAAIIGELADKLKDSNGVSQVIEELSRLVSADQLAILKAANTATELAKNLLLIGGQREAPLGSFSPRWNIVTLEEQKWAENLTTFLEAGVNIRDALTLIKDQSPPSVAEATERAINALENGDFVKALGGHSSPFSPIFQALLHAGVETGQLLQITSKLAERSNPVLWGFNNEPLIRFTEGLNLLIDSGHPLMRCLQILAEIETENSPLKTAILDMAEKIRRGSTFSEALKAHPSFFDKTYIQMITAGELAGVLEITSNRLVNHLKNSDMNGSRIVSPAVAKWSALLGTLVASGVPILQSLNLVKANSRGALAEATKAIFDEVREGESMVTAMVKFPQIFSPAFIALIDVGEETGQLPEVLQRAANVSSPKNQSIENAKLQEFSYSMYVLIDSGLPLMRALAVLIRNEPEQGKFRKVLQQTYDDVGNGWTFSEAISKHPEVFPSMYVGFVKAGELGGILNLTFDNLSSYLEKEGHAIKPRYDFVSEDLALWSENLAALLESGVPQNQSLSILKDAASDPLAKVMPAIRNDLSNRGLSLAESLRKHPQVFPHEFVSVIAAGEFAKNLPKALRLLSERKYIQ